ncbi:MAG TPA: metallophosphoesterase family protein [Tenuifilaceae bacterium]|jgi:putative phosphoesterase|nr:metallophosphoesterase family protein [Bacteroidales bacterium]HNT41053.1 metallophosphoesterase family protein [Tenuifilaceae bacterium]MBP8643276.1 metallophosphoesterase family protein [Bacteroidales bacterium]HNY09343.1 metallophosphoesterase family protein [Tenuifilaceae bacterium]HOA09067.1 metallophosphoesterase family protein [Tenuifilaceae bacterium]
MKRIGILSDTHGTLDDGVMEFFSDVDEIWHAGDIGSLSLADRLASFRPFRAVYGNVDDARVRLSYPLSQHFRVEDIVVFMTHIGGRPGRYEPIVYEAINSNEVNLLVCGHSHILLVKFDSKHNLLFINPGAAGNNGFHKVKTVVKLDIEGKQMKNLQVWEKTRF